MSGSDRFASLCVCGYTWWTNGSSHPSWTDNKGAESVSNKLFTSSYPLGVFAQRLALFSCFSGLELDTSHISGPRNQLADWLSRWNGHDALPAGILEQFRIRLDLRQLWFREHCTSVCPTGVDLGWDLPKLRLFEIQDDNDSPGPAA